MLEEAAVPVGHELRTLRLLPGSVFVLLLEQDLDGRSLRDSEILQRDLQVDGLEIWGEMEINIFFIFFSMGPFLGSLFTSVVGSFD